MSVALTSPEDRTALAGALLELKGQGPGVDEATHWAIERFLRLEARLLDEERYRDWYALLAEDLFYWAPLRENRYRRDPRAEISPGNMAFFDESKADIDLRIQRLESGMAWTEDPPTRHVYAVTNVEAFETSRSGEYEVHSVVILYRNRSERDDSTLMARRRDILRSDPGASQFQIARRLVLLQQSVLLAKNLSVFF